MTAKRQSYHHGALREALINHAREQLAGDGAETVSLRSVARAAGVDASAVYRHFASRSDLMRAVAEVGKLELALRMAEEISRSRAAAGSEGPAMRALIACGEGYLGFAIEQPGMFSIISAADGQDVVPADTRNGEAKDVLNLLAESLDALGVKAGLPAGNRGEPERLALAGLHGLAHLWIGGALGRDPGRLHAMGARLLRLLVAGLRENS